jgi:hypothetical protein
VSTFSIDDAQKLVALVHEAVGMMEPYYSQCGAGDRILEELAPFEAKLPYFEHVVPWKAGCLACGKRFYSAQSTAQHMHSKHPQQFTSKQAYAEMREYTKTWPTKAAYLSREV